MSIVLQNKLKTFYWFSLNICDADCPPDKPLDVGVSASKLIHCL